MINIILFPFFLTVSFHPSLNIRIFLCLYSVGNSSVVWIISNNERAFYFILCFFVGSTLLGHTQDAIVIALYGTAATIEQTSSYNTHNTEEKGKFYITPDRGGRQVTSVKTAVSPLPYRGIPQCTSWHPKDPFWRMTVPPVIDWTIGQLILATGGTGLIQLTVWLCRPYL